MNKTTDVTISSNSPDDQRTKISWGYISALPSEYLIHFKRGKFSEKTSGQGKTCFKWFNDAVFIIPTTLKELVFEASQLTKDNVDVRIKGMAVYRISEPLRIYKLINWQSRQASEQKLADMIGGMCRSTSKWLVSNMDLAECIRKRKEEIADLLKLEISQVVADNEKGWGVDLVTIHINDVFVVDPDIFQAMQGIFKADKLYENQVAELDAENNLQLKRIANDVFLAERYREKEFQKAKIESELTDQQLDLSRQNDLKKFELEMFRAQEKEKITNFTFEEELKRLRRKKDADLENARINAVCKKVEHDEIAEFREKMISAENQIAPQTIEMRYIEKGLPVIAEAITKNLSGANITVYQQSGEGGGLPVNMIIMEVIEALKKGTLLSRADK